MARRSLVCLACCRSRPFLPRDPLMLDAYSGSSRPRAPMHLPPIYPITDAQLATPLSDQIRVLGEAGYPLVQFRGKRAVQITHQLESLK